MKDPFNSPSEFRIAVREKRWQAPTAGICPGYVQANLVILPYEYAFYFLLFCQRNPKPCPVLEVLEPGQWEARHLAPGSDIRKDLPRYKVFSKGRVEETNDISDIWRDDLVSFLIGCSFTFESGLIKAGVPVRHVEEGKNVPMYITNIPCHPSGPFHGSMVVSMRPLPPKLITKAVQVTSRFPSVHGAPIHIGDPKALGIHDLSKPDFGDPVTINEVEIPVFWACGVTPQVALLNAGLEFAISHAPGHMFVTDLLDEELAIF